MKPQPAGQALIGAVVLVLCSAAICAQSLPQTALTVIHHFTSTEGTGPAGALTQGPDGTLYGALSAGGTFGQGSVFALNASNQLQTLFSFGSTAAPIASTNGASPVSGPIFGADGNLYGTTSQGGQNFGGTIYRLTPAGALTTMVALGASATDGINPFAPLYLGPDGNYYGTATSGGAGGAGTIFQMTPSGTVTTLHNFAADGSEGARVNGALVAGPDGALYGATSVGGFNAGVGGDGTVFRLTTAGQFSVLHFFPYTATNVLGGLTFGPDGSPYGMTQLSSAGAGNVYTVTTFGEYTDLWEFGCSCGTPAGSQPVGSLTLATDGAFYGVTLYGGVYNSGTIFRMSPSGAVTPLHSFSASEGGAPAGGLIQGADGRLYGMTSGAFTHDPTIYKLALLPTPPSTPTSRATSGSITLAWSPTTSANTYDVYQATSPGAEGTTAAITAITTPAATVTGLHNGTAYYFTVVAVNEAGSGPPSGEVTAMPIAAPTQLTALPGNNSVTLTWANAAGASSYNVYEGTAAGAEASSPIATGVNGTSYSVGGLSNGATYFFKVASVNGSTVVLSAAEASTTPTGGAQGGGGGGGTMSDVSVFILGILTLTRRCSDLRRRNQLQSSID